MIKEDFFKLVESSITDFLPREVADNCQVAIHQVYKTNDICLNGLTVHRQGVAASPNIYLEPYYNKLTEGGDLSQILTEIAEDYMRGMSRVPCQSHLSLDFEEVKNKIVFQLVEANRNVKRLEGLVHKELECGLAMTYAIVVPDIVGDEGRISITKDFCQSEGYEEVSIERAAMENTPKALPPILMTISQAVMSPLYSATTISPKGSGPLWDIEELGTKENIYVLTNPQGIHGAACIMYPGVLERIGELLQEDYYVLPSSIHEVLILPTSFGNDMVELGDMVREINQKEVEPGDVLSDNVMVYCRDTKGLFLAATGKKIKNRKGCTVFVPSMDINMLPN